MQGKGLSLRLSLVALVVVLVFGTLGGFSLARDAFDADYDDCPAATRLDAIGGLTIDRTDEEDEIRVSWDSLDTVALSSLGPNGYRARLTVIVDGEDARNVALGDTDLVISGIDFAEDLTVSLAVTLGDYVISDIAEADFTSGLPAPRFSSNIWVSRNAITGVAADSGLTDVTGDAAGLADAAADRAEIAFLRGTAENNEDVRAALATYDDSDKDNDARSALITVLEDAANQVGDVPAEPLRTARRVAAANVVVRSDDGPEELANGNAKDLGTFYFLGFNDLFDNWYVASGVSQRPSSPKFRVGLLHGSSGVDAGNADFENYRIVIEDSSGDLLGYQAETVSASSTYGSNKIVFATNGAEFLTEDDWGGATNFSNIRLSNNVTDNGAVSPYYGRIDAGDDRPAGLRSDLAFGNVGIVNAATNTFPAIDVLYADSPVEYFDFPSDVFEADGSYTIKAWAEDDDGTRISPQTSIKIGAQEGEPAEDATGTAAIAGVSEYDAGIRSFGTAEAHQGNSLTVYGFSIQDE